MISTKILSVALLAALAFVGLQSMRLANERTAHSETRVEQANQRVDWHRESRVAVETARAEEQRRTAAVQKEADEADRLRRAAESSAAAADDAGQRMRGQLAALTARLRLATSGAAAPAASSGVPSSDALDLLAGMLTRHSQELVDVGKYADRLRIAGETCERSYNALTAYPAPTP